MLLYYDDGPYYGARNKEGKDGMRLKLSETSRVTRIFFYLLQSKHLDRFLTRHRRSVTAASIWGI